LKGFDENESTFFNEEKVEELREKAIEFINRAKMILEG
jgi:hypothetical protein